MKYLWIILVTMLSIPINSWADWVTHGFTIPSDHPRLLWDDDRIATAGVWLGLNPDPATWTCEYPPTGAGDYFCQAYKHVVRGDSCTQAVTWAANVNQSSPVHGWPPSAEQTLTTAIGSDTMRTIAETAYIVFDWCYDEWSTEQKSTFISNNLTWVQNVDQQSWGGSTMTQSNYFLGNLRNALEFGIIAYGETGCGSGTGSACDNLISAAIDTRYGNFKSDALVYYKGGIPEEGTEYGTAFSYWEIPFESVKLMGRDLYAESDWNKQILYSTIYGTTPAPTVGTQITGGAYQFFTFADDEITPDGGIYKNRSYWQDWLSRQSNYWTGTISGYVRLLYNRLVDDSNTKGLSPWFQSLDESPTAASSFSALPLDYYAKGNLQYSYVRTAWDTSSTVSLLQLGSPYVSGHSHYDFGNLSIWRGGRWVMRESVAYQGGNFFVGTPGIANSAQQDSNSMLAHNTLVFTNVRLGVSDPVVMPSRPIGNVMVRRVESATGYYYSAADLTPTYTWESGYSQYNTGVVGHVEADYVYIRSLETWVRLYRVLTAAQTVGGTQTAAGTVTSLISHCETDPTIEDSQHFTCTSGAQVARQTVLIPASATHRVITEGDVGQYRIEVDNSGAAQRYHLDVIQARGSADENITASVVDSNSGSTTSGTFTVTLHPATGSDTIIVFNKGQTSSGGTIDVGGAGVGNLRTTVQNITYTDNGPLWSTGEHTSAGIKSTGTSLSSKATGTPISILE